MYHFSHRQINHSTAVLTKPLYKWSLNNQIMYHFSHRQITTLLLYLLNHTINGLKATIEWLASSDITGHIERS